MIGTESPEKHTPPTSTADNAATHPRWPTSPFLGVIIWSDDTKEDPTVIADRNPVTLARTMATTIHDMIDDSPAYAGAPEFLESNPPPQDWVLPEDVDAWLEALREAHPVPGVLVPSDINYWWGRRHQPHRRAPLLGDALQEREHSLNSEAVDAPRHEPAGQAHHL